MKLCLILVAVLLWDFLSPVAPENHRYFLEIAKTSVDTTKLIGKWSQKGDTVKKAPESGPEGVDGGFSIILYECIPDFKYRLLYVIACRQVDDLQEKQRIYAIGNFNGVLELELPDKHMVKMDGNEILKSFPQSHRVLAIGVEPRNYWGPSFIPALDDMNVVSHRFRNFFDLDIVPKGRYEYQLWRQLFSINVVTYFIDHKTETPILFDRLVTILQKVIDASGYNNHQGSPVSSPDKKKSANNVVSRLRSLTRSNSRTQSSSSNLWKAVGQTLYWSQFKRKIPSWYWSRVRSFSFNGSWSKTQSPTRSRSYWKTSAPSPSRSPSLSDSTILEAAGFLTLRMFDPCFIQWILHTSLGTAEQHCTTYCQFISATIQVYGQITAKECEQMRTGSCVDKLCVCAPRRGVTTGDWNMVHCNNALRSHIYQQVAQNP